MDFNSTVDLIIKDLNEAREIIDDLKNYPGVPVIQLELAKSKCKSAADVIALLKQSDTIRSSEEKDAVVKSDDKIQEEKELQRKEPALEKTSPEIISRTEVTAAHKPEQTRLVKKGTAPAAIIADKFSPPDDRINEQMRIKREEDGLAELLKSKPLDNLSEAIGINDRFFFIREIFNGNNEYYNQAITELEKAGSIEEARSVLKKMTGVSEESEAIIQLMDLVKRKFAPNE